MIFRDSPAAIIFFLPRQGPKSRNLVDPKRRITVRMIANPSNLLKQSGLSGRERREIDYLLREVAMVIPRNASTLENECL